MNASGAEPIMNVRATVAGSDVTVSCTADQLENAAAIGGRLLQGCQGRSDEQSAGGGSQSANPFCSASRPTANPFCACAAAAATAAVGAAATSTSNPLPSANRNANPFFAGGAV